MFFAAAVAGCGTDAMSDASAEVVESPAEVGEPTPTPFAPCTVARRGTPVPCDGECCDGGFATGPLTPDGSCTFIGIIDSFDRDCPRGPHRVRWSIKNGRIEMVVETMFTHQKNPIIYLDIPDHNQRAAAIRKILVAGKDERIADGSAWTNGECLTIGTYQRFDEGRGVCGSSRFSGVYAPRTPTPDL